MTGGAVRRGRAPLLGRLVSTRPASGPRLSMAWSRLSCVRWIALCSCWTLSALPQDIRGSSDVVVQPPVGVVLHPVLLVGRSALQAGNRNRRIRHACCAWINRRNTRAQAAVVQPLGAGLLGADHS